jgi:hypothetical protein
MDSRNHSLIKQVIYVSKPIDFDKKILDQILLQSAANNEKNNITGALICRSDLYLQFLEGPAHKVDDLYSRINTDTRHGEVKLLEETRSKRRLFSNWAMKGDPAKEWMWTRSEIIDGILERLSKDDAMNIFVKHSKEIDQFLP